MDKSLSLPPSFDWLAKFASQSKLGGKLNGHVKMLKLKRYKEELAADLKLF